MKFYERVISDFGGYEKCKDILNQPNIDFIMNAQGLREHMLEYRRQHNIFEDGDLVVSRCNAKETRIFKYETTIGKNIVVKCKKGKVYCYPKKWFSHATDSEIKAGKRLEVG
ncbi:hypothetical protein [Acinetobacter sp. CS-2]|uniref:hypothetical protein n=1 Tax=Acinetobacter sp. CS-2 TaxID=2798861 RepID=UPI001903517B|nr:hypothetical protein [Acinetobacter sp. CS-2]QQN40504.1 hypothetical protein JFY49_06280 [Acinetobacter sp. CS-2]